MEANLLLTRAEAQKALGIHLRTLDRLIASGELPVVRFGRRITRIRRETLQEFLRARETRRPTPAEAA